jgi:hypothetical protein
MILVSLNLIGRMLINQILHGNRSSFYTLRIHDSLIVLYFSLATFMVNLVCTYPCNILVICFTCFWPIYKKVSNSLSVGVDEYDCHELLEDFEGQRMANNL